MSETKKFNKWVYVGVAVFVVFGFFVSNSYFKEEKSGIDFVVADRSLLIQEVSVTGNVKPVDEVNLGFEINGRVSSVNIEVGDKVFAGKVLMRLDDRDLNAKLLRARANLTEEEANLAKLKAGTRIEEIDIQNAKVENAKTALVDAKKDTLNKLRDAYSRSDDAIRNKVDQLFNNPKSMNPELGVVVSNNQLEADVESSRLDIKQMFITWENDLTKLTKGSDLLSFATMTDENLSQVRDFLDSVALVANSLTKNASLSQTTVDGYKSDIWSARSSVNTAISNLSTAKEKLRSAQSVLFIAQKELALKEAGATYEELAAQDARVLSASASVEDILAEIEKTVVYSPISGVVASVDIKSGEMVSPNSTPISIISDNDFEIEANIAEADIAKISIGDSADVTLDAYGDSVLFKAVVADIDPAETVIEGVPTYKTTFNILPNAKSVKSGMTANIDILTDRKADVIAIPARAVKTVDGKKIVKILKNENTTEEREVETGLRGSDGRIEILKGIEEGEKVIIFML